MSKKCAVKGCENRYRHRKSNLTFHRIPKDPEIRKKWVLACKYDDSRRRHDTDARVCCTHFEESSYEPTSLKYTLLNIAVPKNQRRLKAGAVPTILLPHQQGECWFFFKWIRFEFKVRFDGADWHTVGGVGMLSLSLMALWDEILSSCNAVVLKLGVITPMGVMKPFLRGNEVFLKLKIL